MTAHSIALEEFLPHAARVDEEEPTFDGERVHIIPEVVYIDLMDNFFGQDEGQKTYFNIKWQVDF